MAESTSLLQPQTQSDFEAQADWYGYAYMAERCRDAHMSWPTHELADT
jgi:hypothetical protein